MAKTSKVKLSKDKTVDGYRIGAIAAAVGRGVLSVRRYEKLGAIDPPKWRAKKTHQRIYSKGEFDLAVTAIRMWLDEHGGGFPSPSLVRLGQIYRDMRDKGLRNDPEHYQIFILPAGYQLPDIVTNGGVDVGAETEHEDNDTEEEEADS